VKLSEPGLVCAATADELQTFGLAGAEVVEADRLWRIREGYAAVTGVGIPVTLLRLIPWLESLKPAWLLNIGIAGAYPDSGFNIGDVTVGVSEVFADIGMELPNEEAFTPLAKTPFADPLLQTPLALEIPDWVRESEAPLRVRLGRGATVNSCTGRAGTGLLRRELFGADFESMEGAALALAATVRRIPMFEVRSISNIASDRDMRPENIQAALRSLRTFWEARRSQLS